MGETTSSNDKVNRDEAADLLQEVARELRGDGHADIRIGNKTLTVSPASVLDYQIEARERSPMLGGDREELTISLGWEAETTDE